MWWNIFFEHAWSLCHAVHAAIYPAADAHNTGELQEWQRQYCGGVRQRSVRDISKYDAGTLPSFVNAEEMNQAEVTSSRMHFEGEQCGDENVVEAVNGEHHPVQVLFQKGVVLAVKPARDTICLFQMTSQEQISILL